MKNPKFAEEIFQRSLRKAKIFQIGYNFPREAPKNCVSVKISDLITDRPDIYNYCQDMCGDNWCWFRPLSYNWTTIYFLNANDALAFKLRFETI